LHGIGSPEHGVTEDERSYWISRQAFISLLHTIVVDREGSGLHTIATGAGSTRRCSMSKLMPPATA
jgi:hypothetical protein